MTKPSTKKQTQPPSVCLHRGLEVQGRFFTVTLKNGYRTSFTVQHCQDCGGYVGQPELNYHMAVRDGWKLPSSRLVN